ncbi:RNA-binding protein [Chakrabartyella piscis]|uniref:YlmH family RNA-binding protein n=1 Tax=Chakrabartyella piscis TaxID=2918914 RepID=UPI002958BC55|nr:YlmH/Sll1252 family protein [Chakrabartyella piscis]
MDKKAILKHITDAGERILFAKVLDLVLFATKRREPQFSDFMDMAKCRRFAEYLQSERGVSIMIFGGGDALERCIIGMFPDGTEPSEEAFPIVGVSIEKKSQKFGQKDLSHRDYLGSILGLGIDRSKIGDILLTNNGDAICFVKEDMASYICASLEQVSRTRVVVSEKQVSDVLIPKRIQEKRVTVASLRLDAVLGEAFSLSRGKAQNLVSGEKVNVNWSLQTNTSYTLKEGDMVSARGFGRFLVGTIGGQTKKGRVGLTLEMYI